MDPLTVGLIKTGTAMITDKLFGKKSPKPKTTADHIQDFNQYLGSLPETQFGSTQGSYDMIQGGTRGTSNVNPTFADTLKTFSTPDMANNALNQSYAGYSNMAQNGFGSEEMRKLSNEEFSLAKQNSSQAFKDQLGQLDSMMAARGIGQSGLAVGQVSELAQRSTLDLATLANQIATRNSETQRAYQLQGLQGVGNTGQVAYGQATNTFNTNQAAAQNNFNQRLQAANQGQQFFQQQEGLNQQSYGNAMNAEQLNMQQQQFLDQLKMSDNSQRYSTASGLFGAGSAQQNAYYANQLKDNNAYNSGIGQLFGSAFEDTQKYNALKDINSQQQNFMNELKDYNAPTYDTQWDAFMGMDLG